MDRAELAPGQPAPDFTLPDQDGSLVSLAHFRGRRVVVYFYAKDDSPGCTAEACQFNNSLPAFSGLGIDVVGVYHSHPDVAARPSRSDLESAWPWYSACASNWRCTTALWKPPLCCATHWR